MQDWIYLDNNATTKPLDAVIKAMLLCLDEAYANPSSVHQFGQSVRHRVECARAQVGQLIGAEPGEIVFTASGTESLNLAIRGTLAAKPAKKHVIASTVEHSAVRRLCQQLAREGYRIDEIPVDREGRLDLGVLEYKINEETALVSVLWANNETGVLFDVESVARIAADHGVPLHLDAVQAIGKVVIDIENLPVQLLSMAAHKFHGPKGVGALYVRKRTRLRPIVIGGSQERDLRSGTENVAAIVGMGVAAEALQNQSTDEKTRIENLRDRLERDIAKAVAIARINGAGGPRIRNTANIGFHALQAEALLLLLSENRICASAGSACSSGSLEPSHVLQAMGIEQEYAHGSIRFSLSKFTTEAEIDQVVGLIPKLVKRLSVMTK